MTKTLLLVPTTIGVGLSTVAGGLMRAFEHQGVKASHYRPISHESSDTPYHYTPSQVEKMIHQGQLNQLLEQILMGHEQFSQQSDLLIMQGMNIEQNYPLAQTLNAEIIKTLHANTLFVATPLTQQLDELIDQIASTMHTYCDNCKIQHAAGVIINKFNPPFDHEGNITLDISAEKDNRQDSELLEQFRTKYSESLPLLGIIPWRKSLLLPRMLDIANYLSATVINDGELAQRRVSQITLCARNVSNVLHVLQPGTLVITPADRSDIIIAASLASLSGTRLAGLVLTGNTAITEEIGQLCHQAFAAGLPVLSVETDSFRTALMLKNLYFHIPQDDHERLEASHEFIAEHIDANWMKTLLAQHNNRPLFSPAAFRHYIITQAQQANRTIVLPEGNEPRILQAAAICAERRIAQIKLLGHHETILRTAHNLGITLPPALTIVNPDSVRDHYIEPLVARRKHRGMIKAIAQETLQDNIYLGMMMLYQGDVDGLVAGADNTTANTVRPALQIIKTADDNTLVSSIFFMCMEEQVLVFGDCAINPDPDANQLAEIARQSATTANHFGIDPVVALLSYSTGSSASGVDVKKVVEATALIRQRYPDLNVDGPLQYDAALIKSVAAKKAPDSQVAGHATVLIFPDLNTGNTTYKAVQRSADILSIGPILQGLNKPVNDLSRGATVDDIVYTIAITAVQAAAQPHHPYPSPTTSH